ncbi:DUF500-domain-containing protein [Auriscalpium vulgare]|uniref:DUF500-domain-containing protein n=1 Tax=Auriscalpium vulgare TaxID=40419 RepID=A0ACB8S9P4_9AGAM|nr:DUF500-domain-containing protein [Auriscalpium vulgare]
MKLNNPLPQPLPKECDKAAKIFKSFVDNGNNGLDGIIPRSVLENARGFAIFTIFKAGFLFSARAGGGVVIARLNDGSWSSPSAIGLAGLGVGGQVGAEMTDFLVVLNSSSAVRSFMAAGSLTLGGNMSLAVGPLGRNGEASGALSTAGKMAAMYSYSKTRGLFGGVSVEGSVIVERQDANAQAYQSDVSAKQLLSGSVTPPEWANNLIRTLEACTGMPGSRAWVNDGAPGSGSPLEGNYAFGGLGSSGSVTPASMKKQQRKDSTSSGFPPKAWGTRKHSGSYFEPEDSTQEFARTGSTAASWDYDRPMRVGNDLAGGVSTRAPAFETQFESDFMPESDARPRANMPRYSHNSSSSVDTGSRRPQSGASSHFRSMSTAPSTNPFQARPAEASPDYDIRDPFAPTIDDLDDEISSKTKQLHLEATRKKTLEAHKELTKPLVAGVGRAIALYDFKAVQPGDLSFSKGQVITILEKSNNTDTWWRGQVDNREGIFPANFVDVV